MKKLILNKYVILYLIVYLSSLALMIFIEDYPAGELISIFILLGPILTSIAYFVSMTSIPLFSDRKAQQNESYLIIALIAYFMIAITFHGEFLGLFLGERLQDNVRLENLSTLFFKLLAFPERLGNPSSPEDFLYPEKPGHISGHGKHLVPGSVLYGQRGQANQGRTLKPKTAAVRTACFLCMADPGSRRR
jgi:hypothetical protein